MQTGPFNVPEHPRDAIVLSGWTWEASNVPERIALALASLGARVLYCENPASFIREVPRFLEVSAGVFRLRPKFISHRLNRFGPFLQMQSVVIANQIFHRARTTQLRDPLLIYPHGDYCLGLCREFKKRGFSLIHVCMDYELDIQMDHVRESNVSLVIPRIACEELKQQFGQKIRLLPQMSMVGYEGLSKPVADLPEYAEIPRPRLGYIGNLTGRGAFPILRELLAKHPEWNFVSFGSKKWFDLPNEYVLPWYSQGGVQQVVAGLDVGFMPYDCSNPYNLHCVPLKLFDYFAQGIPVVTTPITAIQEYEGLVYVGRTVEELADAIKSALQESSQSVKRQQRMEVARQHSIKCVAPTLWSLINSVDT